MNTITTKIITKSKEKYSPFIVGVCGGSASGISTLAESIKDSKL